MTDKQILDWCRKQSDENGFIEFGEEIFGSLSHHQAELIKNKLSHNTLMRLPADEIKFFDWLKEADYKVWHDLWNGDDLEHPPYIISLAFLPEIIDSSGGGFPICDLLTADNYYFTIGHMVDKESKILIDSVRERFANKDKLTVAQLLVLEISLGPVDIWHFAYKYNLKVEKAKSAAHELVEDDVLVHLKEAEHLAGFIEF